MLFCVYADLNHLSTNELFNTKSDYTAVYEYHPVQTTTSQLVSLGFFLLHNFKILWYDDLN